MAEVDQSRLIGFLGDVLVGVVGHQAGCDNADDDAEQYVDGDRIARPGSVSSAVAINGAGPPENIAPLGVKHSAINAAWEPYIKSCGTKDRTMAMKISSGTPVLSRPST